MDLLIGEYVNVAVVLGNLELISWSVNTKSKELHGEFANLNLRKGGISDEA